MPNRRKIKVVFDTNVFIGNFLAPRDTSPNRRVVRLWLRDRRIKLVVSGEILDEYLRIFEDVLAFDKERIRRWRERLSDRRLTIAARPGAIKQISRDAKDNVFIAVAAIAKCKYLVTNDRDLLDIDDSAKRQLEIEIVTPFRLLSYMAGSHHRKAES